MENPGSRNPIWGERGAAGVDQQGLRLVVCMLYLRLTSSFLMMLFLQRNGQKGKSFRTGKKRGVACCP